MTITQDIVVKAIIKAIDRAKGDATNYDCLYDIAQVMQEQLGHDEARSVGYDGAESKGYSNVREAEAIADKAAAAYLISQGYDIPADASYGSVWDTLGGEAEDVYQSVWCAIVYDADEVWVRW